MVGKLLVIIAKQNHKRVSNTKKNYDTAKNKFQQSFLVFALIKTLSCYD